MSNMSINLKQKEDDLFGLKGLSLEQLCSEIDKELSDSLWCENFEESFFYALSKELKKVPYLLTGFINSLFARVNPVIMDNSFPRPFLDLETKEIKTKYDDPGNLARIISNLTGISSQELPKWLTHNLEQYKEYHQLRIYALTQELIKKLKENKNKSYLVDKLEGLINKFYRYKKIDYLDLNSIIRTLNSKKNNPPINNIHRLIVTSIITLALAGLSGVMTYNSVYNKLQESDKNRTYEIAEQIPPSLDPMHGAVPLSIQIGNLSGIADRCYMSLYDGEGNFNDEFPKFLDNLSTAKEQAKIVISVYRDPNLQRAVSSIEIGFGRIVNSISESIRNEVYNECDDEGHCESQCKKRVFILSKNQESITWGFGEMWYGLETIVNGKPFKDITFHEIKPGPNANNSIVLIYKNAGSSLLIIRNDLEDYERKIASYPDFEEKVDYNCISLSASWGPKEEINKLEPYINNITSLNRIPEKLEKFLDLSEKYEEMLKNAKSDKERARILGDYSIELHRIFGYPGEGHLFQREINLISYGAGTLIFFFVLGGGYIIYKTFIEF
ncbi:MAG: hypothetical protein QXE31_05780 [Candidatus Woesearchaeota archaeon]